MKDVQKNTNESSKYPNTPLALFFAKKSLEAAIKEGAVLVVLADEKSE